MSSNAPRTADAEASCALRTSKTLGVPPPYCARASSIGVMTARKSDDNCARAACARFAASANSDAQSIQSDRGVGARRRQQDHDRLVRSRGPRAQCVGLRAAVLIAREFGRQIAGGGANPDGKRSKPQHEVRRHTVGFKLFGNQPVEILKVVFERSLVSREAIEAFGCRGQRF